VEDGSLGRLINDNHRKPNCRPKVQVVDGKPHLVFFAIKDISYGEELLFDYGDTGNFPWREVRYNLVFYDPKTFIFETSSQMSFGSKLNPTTFDEIHYILRLLVMDTYT